ncbi:MAG: hypothetical protein U0992_05640 [Planctomycetaceae bacterium]
MPRALQQLELKRSSCTGCTLTTNRSPPRIGPSRSSQQADARGPIRSTSGK